jgi:hypothetical protein
MFGRAPQDAFKFSAQCGDVPIIEFAKQNRKFYGRNLSGSYRAMLENMNRARVDCASAKIKLPRCIWRDHE